MDQQELFVKMALGNWHLQFSRLEKTLDTLTDEQLHQEIVPGKNRPLYLLGHFIAYHDMLGESLGLAERKYQHLDEPFLKNPDKAGFDIPDAAALRKAFADVHENLHQLFGDVPTADWFKKHNLVSDADFATDPSRNRLNMVMNRSAHMAYHVGQLKLI